MSLQFKDGEITGSSGVAKAGLTLGIIGTALGAMTGGFGNGTGILGNLTGTGCQSQVAALESRVAELQAMRYTDYVGMDLYKNIVSTAKEEDAKIGAVQKELLSYVIELDKQTALNKQASDYQFMIMNNKIDCCCDKVGMQLDFNRQLGAISDNSILNYVQSNYVSGILKLPITSICPEPATATA